MAIVPLVHTQLVPPSVRNYISRPRLMDLGLSILTYRVTTVTAPAGFGKSVWVSSLLEEHGWPPTAWLSLDRHDSEPSFLLYHLIHAVKRVFPEFGKQVLLTMNSLEDAGRDWLIAVSSLIEEIQGEREFVLVLDDVHLINENTVVCGILEHLARWLPEETHLVLISRNNLPLNLYRLRISGELLEIESDRLLFSEEEALRLLSSMDLKLGLEDVRAVHSCTEGWAAGLRLLGILLKKSGENIINTMSALKRKDTDLYAYLSNELLDYLPVEHKDFLLDSSLLPYLEPELCNAALECSDSEAKIKDLHSHGVLSRSEGETVTWRLHHLMAEFLGQKVIQLRPPDYVVLVRRRAAAFLENKGDIDRALEQLAACADWPAAVNLIYDHGDRYFLQSGRLDALNSWMERLPGNIVSNDCQLLYLKGMSILHINSDEALDTLSHAADCAGKKGNIKYQLRSLLAMIAVYTFANDVKKIKETASRIPVAASLVKSSWSRGVIMVAALSRAAWEDNLRQGVWLSWMASKSNLDSESKMAHLIFTIIIQYRLGNLVTAGELVEKTLAAPYVQDNERWTGTVYTIYAVICVLMGDMKKLADVCKELLRLGEKYNVPHQLGIAHRRLGLLYMGDGHLDKARKAYEISRNFFIKSNNIFYAYLTDLDLIMLSIRAGENPRDLLSETQNILEQLKSFPGGQGLDDYALSVAGIIAMEAGQLELAGQWFGEVYLKSKRKGARHVLAGTRLLLSRVYLLQGKYDEADSLLRRSLGAAESEKWEYFWDWHDETIYALCRRALLKKIHPQWAAHLLRRWFPRRTCKEAGYLLAYPDEGVRNIIAIMQQDMVRQTGVPVVHVNCLGGFRVFVNGVEISPSHWKTQKAENLFKYLIIDRRQRHKERIIEELWPESDLRLGDASLRMALTNVRKALGLGDNVSESIILKRGIVCLSPEIDVFTDYELFSSTAQGALQEEDVDNPVVTDLLERAAGLYSGEFLPDNPYEDWTAGLRAQLRRLYLQVLLKLVKTYSAQGKPELAIYTCRRYLVLEPADEPVSRTAMELLLQGGQKQQALSLYQELAAALAKEYSIAPDAETNILYKKIREEEITLK
ncbi:MAG: BTAD domain-containing putative transcriptional regulator [Bacillota bacterium]